MNPLDQLLQMLFGQAKPRQDLGSAVPVATFAGRVVHPGDTTQSALARMPMGSGEGDLQTALTASLGAMAQPAMQVGASAATKALVPKLLATMIPAMRVYHGTPSGVAGGLPTAEMGQKFGPMIGTKGHFVSQSPEAASVYSQGAISEANSLLNKGDYAPSVRPYQMSGHQSLGTNVPVTAQELAGVLQAIEQTYNPAPKQTKFGVTSPATQQANLRAAVENGMIPDVSPGEHLRGILSGMLGPQAGEDMLKAGGFKSIYYPGEHSATMHMDNAQAFKVLDNSILQTLFDALASGKPAPTP